MVEVWPSVLYKNKLQSPPGSRNVRPHTYCIDKNKRTKTTKGTKTKSEGKVVKSRDTELHSFTGRREQAMGTPCVWSEQGEDSCMSRQKVQVGARYGSGGGQGFDCWLSVHRWGGGHLRGGHLWQGRRVQGPQKVSVLSQPVVVVVVVVLVVFVVVDLLSVSSSSLSSYSCLFFFFFYHLFFHFSSCFLISSSICFLLFFWGGGGGEACVCFVFVFLLLLFFFFLSMSLCCRHVKQLRKRQWLPVAGRSLEETKKDRKEESAWLMHELLLPETYQLNGILDYPTASSMTEIVVHNFVEEVVR